MRTPTGTESISIVQPAADDYARRTLTLDFLYLNNESCERCMGTENALMAALEQVAPILESVDTSITVRDIHVSTLEAAKATQLAVSPTIRIGGQDIQPDYIENTCESCGDLCACDGDVDCRLWRFRGKEYTTAPVELIVEALIQAIVSPSARIDASHPGDAYRLSSNVQSFFTGKEDAGHACGCDC
jgi:hypothetical protein